MTFASWCIEECSGWTLAWFDVVLVNDVKQLEEYNTVITGCLKGFRKIKNGVLKPGACALVSISIPAQFMVD